MTRIRAKCPSCGDVEFGVDAIVVVVGSEEDAIGSDRSYRFSCPSCSTSVRRAAVPDVIELLITAGVRIEPTRELKRLRTPRAAATVPRLTDADVDAFREMLGTPDWFDQLKAMDS